MIIAVDAAGGDHYPESPVKGAVDAIKELSNLDIILVGPENIVQTELDKYEYNADRISIYNATQVIEMDESPAQAVKSKNDSSIVSGIGLQKKNECQAFVSAGNTGALLAASSFLLGKLQGVIRPTIAATYPTLKGFRLLMDVGANLEVRPEMYLQFAQMGEIYVREVMGIRSPKLALLNVGEEEEKGTDELKQAYKVLTDLSSFIGNVEGRDIFTARADVYICNGLVGNLLLKFGESIPDAIPKFLKSGIEKLELDQEQAQLVGKVLKTSLSAFNPDNVGGVPFLGVNGVSMVGHGSSTPLAIKNMILNAVKCVEHNINDKIVASLK